MTKTARIQHLNTITGAKASRIGQKNFGVALAGADAMLGVASAAGGTANPTAGAVLSAAFGGIGAAGAAMGQYNAPMFAGATNMSTGFGGGIPGLQGGMPGSSGGAIIPGTEGFSQADMINSMNQNNLQLLELQAMMQSNMQAWNTKSNILNADHRVKTTMIEKLSPR